MTKSETTDDMVGDSAASVHGAVDAEGSSPGWVGIDHVQIAIPIGAEDVARSFYVGVLGLTEVPKPAVMAARGGAWFECGAVRLHVGADDPFVAARKAHPALTMVGLGEFIERSGLDATWNEELPNVIRCHVFDPFGNRIELIEARPAFEVST